LLGRHVRVTVDRGRFLESPLAPRAMVTIHPSAILRSPDDQSRRQELARLVGDLKMAAAALRGAGRA